MIHSIFEFPHRIQENSRNAEAIAIRHTDPDNRMQENELKLWRQDALWIELCVEEVHHQAKNGHC